MVKKLLLILMLITSFSISAQTEFNRGLDFYNKKYYKAASKIWLKEVKAGNYRAQLSIAMAYYAGEGVPKS